MDFFYEWIFTRLRENGWPKSKGLLKRTQVISSRAIDGAMQDAVRAGLVLGSGIPEAARSIAITYVESPTQETVSNWIREGSARGEDKLRKARRRNPMWLQFCTLDTTDRDGNQKYTYASPDDVTFDIYDHKDYYTSMLLTVKAVAVIAMLWAIEHPDECVQLFHIDGLSTEEYQTGLAARGIYDAWLVMAKDMVFRYESVVGLQEFKDLP